MGTERQMLAIAEERYKEITVVDSSHQISSVKADALMDSVHGALPYAGVTGNMAFISSEIRTLELYKNAERVRNWLQEKEITSRQIG